MTLSIRLGDDVNKFLDDLVKKGVYSSKAEAIRAAIELFAEAEAQKKKGRRLVAISEDKLEKLDPVLEMS
ncbi:MAG: ribbon-helix-helix domain-containing protein [Methanobacteriota archaeon]